MLVAPSLLVAATLSALLMRASPPLTFARLRARSARTLLRARPSTRLSDPELVEGSRPARSHSRRDCARRSGRRRCRYCTRDQWTTARHDHFCQGDSGRRSWLLRLCGRPSAAAPRLQVSQRALRTVAARDAEDELAGAACARGARLARARLLALDAACGVGVRGARRARGSRAGPRAPHRVVRASDGRGADLRQRQRRIVDGGGGVRPAPVCRADHPPDDRTGWPHRGRGADALAAGARRDDGALRVVERRPHRRVRDRADEPAAARTAPECLRCVRDAAAAAADPRLPVFPRSELFLPSEIGRAR